MQLSFNEGKKNFNHDLHDRYQVWKNQIEWRNEGEFHRVNGPAMNNAYIQQGQPHSFDSKSVLLSKHSWYVKGILHKIDHPSETYSSTDSYYLYGRLYARQGEVKSYYKNGQLHQDHGPAFIYKDESQFWYINGKYHREDGPAVICKDGTQKWYIKGQLHRIDGPAIIKKDGSQEFWINGQQKDF